MNIQEMARLMAEQERLLRQMQPAFETARQLSRQVQPAVDLVRQYEESFRRIAAGSEAAADAWRVAGIGESLAGWRAALSRDVASFPPAELARLAEVAAAVRQPMRTVPTLAPEMLGVAWNERLADAVAHLQERAERLAGAPDTGAPEDVESLAGDIEALTAVTPAEAQEKVGRWLVLVLCFVLDAFALDPAKEILRDAVARLLVVLLVTAADATVPNSSSSSDIRGPGDGRRGHYRGCTRGYARRDLRIASHWWIDLGRAWPALRRIATGHSFLGQRRDSGCRHGAAPATASRCDTPRRSR